MTFIRVMLGSHRPSNCNQSTNERFGVSVIVEKPFVNSSAEADRCIALAKQQGKILTVFQSM